MITVETPEIVEDEQETVEVPPHSCCVCGSVEKLEVCHACRRPVCKMHIKRALFDCFTRVVLCPVDYLKEFGEG